MASYTSDYSVELTTDKQPTCNCQGCQIQATIDQEVRILTYA